MRTHMLFWGAVLGLLILAVHQAEPHASRHQAKGEPPRHALHHGASAEGVAKHEPRAAKLPPTAAHKHTLDGHGRGAHAEGEESSPRYPNPNSNPNRHAATEEEPEAPDEGVETEPASLEDTSAAEELSLPTAEDPVPVAKAAKSVKVKEETAGSVEARGGGSGGSKGTVMYMDMYKDGFTGSFVMNEAKYRRVPKGEPVRVAKYMFQCLDPNPPRGCDLDAAKRDPPRGRGWQRVARISKEFLQLLPKTDEVREIPRYKSCAVVGNGGSLLLSTAGAAIDTHEAVIRFNGGITKGFEKFVGTKTTLRLTNTQHMGFFENEDEIILQHITMEKAMDKLAEVKAKNPRLQLYATDGDFHQYVLDTMEEGAASNGFFGMVLAYEKCERVTIFGFHKAWKTGDTGANLASTKYHYYDNVEPNESQTRRDDVETPRMWKFLRKHLDVFSFAEGDLDLKLRNTDEVPED